MKELKLPVYLDNNATTRVAPTVVEKMIPYFSEVYGNAASIQHEYGWKAEAAVEVARKQVGGLIGANPKEIIFTSGATESINLALKGIVAAKLTRGNHIITAATEHKAVLDVCRRLQAYGVEVTILSVDRCGAISLDDLKDAITDKTILVSIMLANNEIGTIAPVKEIGAICRERNVLFHTDATQAVGKVSVNVQEMMIDIMSFSSHKIYGPKGVGALYLRRRTPAIKLQPQIDGGGHELGFRSGTVNVPGIVGFGEAAALAQESLDADAARVSAMRDKLENALLYAIPDTHVNGSRAARLPNTTNIAFLGAPADKLMMAMKDVAVASGSACSSSQPESSHVLRALGLADAEAQCSLRFSLGRFTSEQEIDYVIERVKEAVQLVRERSHSFSTKPDSRREDATRSGTAARPDFTH